MRRKEILGFVAEFRDEQAMMKAIKENSVEIPEGWVQRDDNFKVIQDLGTILVLAFWDWDEDKQVGTQIIDVDYDDVICWA